MRIVLDSNVVFSALLWQGTPYRLLEALRRHPEAHLCSSPVLLAELTDILSRPAATKRLAQIQRAPAEVIDSYLELVEIFHPADLPHAISRDPDDDPDDDHVIACAIAARAEIIVSGDRDLLDLGHHGDIRIVNAASATAEIEARR